MRNKQRYRMTKQRKIILEELKKHGSHPTADEIYEKVRKRLPRISLGTVYRNLDLLVSEGLIGRLKGDYPQMRFDPRTDDHYHITCLSCGKIEDAPIEPLQDPIRNLENVVGHLTKYGVFGHKLEFVGFCSECLKKQEGSRNETPEAMEQEETQGAPKREVKA